MKKLFSLLLAGVLLAGCGSAPAETTLPPASGPDLSDATHITLEGRTVTVQGDETAISTDIPLVYYEAGRDFTYGEGEPAESHSPEEAAAHTVVTITKPGTYVLSGQLQGQVAVDLGEEAAADPSAVVTLVLDGVDITNTAAPGVIFYNVYECGDPDNPKAQVDTSAAGANVILAEGSVNTVTGSHVARIYKPDSVVLSEDGSQVLESKKLHKYDGAFYSKMSMNLDGEGQLTIHADNEGLDTEMHLTINGGDVRIYSGNDGINTNEDGVSVTTINGGNLTITVTGETGEGDGIDSNGYLVINGGVVQAWACGSSEDSGIDADMGIWLNGGTVFASGNMTDRMEGGQNYAVFTFAETRKGGEFTLKNQAGAEVLTCNPANSFRNLVISAQVLTEGTYTLWSGSTQFEGAAGGSSSGFAPIDRPDWPQEGAPDVELPVQPTQPVVPQGENGQPPELPEGVQPNGERPSGEAPSGQWPNGEQPEGGRPEPPTGAGFAPAQGGQQPGGFERPGFLAGDRSTEFVIESGGNYFSSVTEVA